ncbi:MAG: hypothetical protein H6Q99_310 [Proteobacteria bacterium]|nr:hypothetical protein [Pseudomonadota bacterium]
MDTRHGGKAIIAGGLGDEVTTPEPEQEELFERDALADAPLFLLEIDQRGNEVTRGGPGRPKGSQNKTTEQMRRVFLSKYRDPLMAAGEIISTPIDVLKVQLGAATNLEAAEFWRKVLVDVLPYIHQKRPIALEGGGISAGVLNVVIGDVVVGNPAGGEFGVNMRLVDGEQNQSLSDSRNAEPHGNAPHDEDK